jgi:nitroreductase
MTQTQTAVHPFITQRRSPRIYQHTLVDHETVVRLLEAARWAASSRNRQPWQFIVATKDDPQEYRRLLHCLNERNQTWAQSAPVLMLVVALMEEEGAPIRHSWYDSGLAVGNLTVQAMAEGLMLRQMGGIDRNKARLVYSIPEAYEAICGLAIGYPADPDTLSEDERERETALRSRKPLSEFVFTGKWGRPAHIVAEQSKK